ncbi:TasA family protein [Caproiciproducens faecalis]|uniref:Camelysin metallo-endopeptidase n=1 Tax=Caproiciproducens faecalis TaxID=2820301 RepID=A0ABS7DKI8_9FIRM|nr:TasA family protein [Caproiciproducens faecalis]MBW7571634.1 hypothetical protein [Caproiciproducens faecalis]
MNFKTKILTSVLAVGLTVALVGGSTMAWFTDSQTVEGATFKAGTVRLSDSSNNLTIGGFTHDNINPGDTFTGSLTIINEGTKPVKLRIKIPTIGWYDHTEDTEDNGLSIDNVKVTLPPDWEKHADGYIYYTGTILEGKPGVIPGTKADGEAYPAGTDLQRQIDLTFTGRFDGLLTNNDYQGKFLKMGASSVELIQATHEDLVSWSSETVPAAVPSNPT